MICITGIISARWLFYSMSLDNSYASVSTELFTSPTYGSLTLDQVKQKIISYMQEDNQARYRLVIGTDSQPKNGHGVDFVTALVVQRIGSGGIYFWKRNVVNKHYVLRQRIYEEASRSLVAATEFVRVFNPVIQADYGIEIHVDIGNVGETRNMIAEVVGMIRGSGFIVKTKPESYGASKVADRHT